MYHLKLVWLSRCHLVFLATKHTLLCFFLIFVKSWHTFLENLLNYFEKSRSIKTHSSTEAEHSLPYFSELLSVLPLVYNIQKPKLPAVTEYLVLLGGFKAELLFCDLSFPVFNHWGTENICNFQLWRSFLSFPAIGKHGSTLHLYRFVLYWHFTKTNKPVCSFVNC